MAVNEGKLFENQIRNSILKLDGVYYCRIPDPPQSFVQASTTKFSNKNPFDALVYNYPYLLALEEKTTNKTSLSFTMDEKKNNTMIHAHQIKGLWNAYLDGVCAGLLINFRDVNRTYFIHILDFVNFMAKTSKKSINEKDVICYNAVLIPQQLMRTKYNYDMSVLFDWVEQNYSDYNLRKCGLKKL